MVEGENWKIKFVFKVSVLVKQKKKQKPVQQQSTN